MSKVHYKEKPLVIILLESLLGPWNMTADNDMDLNRRSTSTDNSNTVVNGSMASNQGYGDIITIQAPCFTAATMSKAHLKDPTDPITRMNDSNQQADTPTERPVGTGSIIITMVIFGQKEPLRKGTDRVNGASMSLGR